MTTSADAIVIQSALIPPPCPPPPARAVVDPEGALVALGQLAAAGDRAHLIDMLAAWHRYLEACGRDELRTAPPLRLVDPDVPRYDERFAELARLAWATAAHRERPDAERHWQAAARAFVQAALDRVAEVGSAIVGIFAATVPDCRSPRLGDLLASQAALAAHLARAVSEPRRGWSDAERRAARGRLAIAGILDAAFDALRLVRLVPDPLQPGSDELVGRCTVCGHLDAHGETCPLASLTPGALLEAYEAARRAPR